jgi:hypothetical protein
MYPQLNPLLGWGDAGVPAGEFVLIRGAASGKAGSMGADPGLFLHHFISLQLRGAGTVGLVTAAQTLNHYLLAGRKMVGVCVDSVCEC